MLGPTNHYQQNHSGSVGSITVSSWKYSQHYVTSQYDKLYYNSLNKKEPARKKNKTKQSKNILVDI